MDVIDTYASKNDLSKDERASYESLRSNMLTSSKLSATQAVSYSEKCASNTGDCDVRMDAFHTESDDENNGMTSIVDDDVPIVRTTGASGGPINPPPPSTGPVRKRSFDATRCRYSECDSQFIPDVGDYDVNDGWMIDDTTPPSSPTRSL